MPNIQRLVTAAILFSIATISLCGNTERCDICTCEVDSKVLKLNCSDVKFRPGENFFKIRLPYAGSYSNYKYDTISAEFNRNEIRTLNRIKMDNLTELFVEGNTIPNIEKGTFVWLESLQHLSLKNNSIETLHEISFQGLMKLQHLDLSQNDIQKFDQGTFIYLKLLKSLSLSNNRLRNINGKIFPDSLQTLDISFNSIDRIEDNAFDNTNNLEVLNLSNNKLNEVKTFMFISMRKLSSLDLSYNNIKKIDSNSFANLNSLRVLSLSNNKLEEVPQDADFSAGIETLDMCNNSFTTIAPPIFAIRNLQALYMQQNKLKSVEMKNGTKLKVLNVSRNQIETFSATLCQNLEVLDLSSNKLTEIPKQLLGEVMPALRRVSLDSNPILHICFPSSGDDERASTGFVNLTWVSVSHLPNLEQLKEGAFSGLSSACGGCGSMTNNTRDTAGELENLGQECTRQLFIRVAHNPRLVNIQQGAFRDVSVCKLDLSYNSLTSLDENVMDWEALQEVDFQGNPWSCNCPLQWMVDTILPKLYDTKPQLLYEFRCDSPVALRNKRLVHFYNWKTPALCMTGDMMQKMRMEPTQTEHVEVVMGFSGSMLAVVLSLAAVGAVLLVAAVVMQRRYNRRFRNRNRRF